MPWHTLLVPASRTRICTRFIRRDSVRLCYLIVCYSRGFYCGGLRIYGKVRISVCVWVCFWDSLCVRNFWFDFQGKLSFTFSSKKHSFVYQFIHISFSFISHFSFFLSLAIYLSLHIFNNGFHNGRLANYIRQSFHNWFTTCPGKPPDHSCKSQ